MKVRYLIYACSLIAGSAFAQQFIYPKNGQSPEQQKKDEFDCHTWAVQQSGYDPIAAAQAAPQQVTTSTSTGPDGSALKGAAVGAAGGAAIGAIAGDAGKGAAIGAVAGGVVNKLRSRNNQKNAQQQQASQTKSAADQQATLATRYQSARAAC